MEQKNVGSEKRYIFTRLILCSHNGDLKINAFPTLCKFEVKYLNYSTFSIVFRHLFIIFSIDFESGNALCIFVYIFLLK